MADICDVPQDVLPIPTPRSTEAGDPAVIAAHFDDLSSAVWMLEGPDHRVVAANRMARTGFGGRARIIGRPAGEALPALIRGELLVHCDQVYASGTPMMSRDWLAGGSADTPDADHDVVITATVQPTTRPGGAVRGLVVRVTLRDAATFRRDTTAASTVMGRRYRDARDVVVALQGSLLPAVLPVLPDVRLAARYLVANSEQAAGGDWFDAVPVGSNLSLVVGDVVGHGATASGVMGQLRAVLTEFLLEGMDLIEALARLDRFAVRVPGASGASVCLARLDRSTGELSYACCGQLPPLVISADGVARVLPVRSGGLLGVDSTAPSLERVQLLPGDVVVLYSDGLVERPGQSLRSGIDTLSELAAKAVAAKAVAEDAVAEDAVGGDRDAAESGAERICARVDQFLAGSDPADDVTLLAAEVGRPTPEPLRMNTLATPAVLADVRRRLGAWLSGIGAGQSDALSIQVASGEAVANVLEHAYPGGQGTVGLEALIDPDGRVCVTVTDQGRWRTPAPDAEIDDLGFNRMRSCMDSVEIDHTGTGTTVLMERQLSQPVIISEYREEPLGAGDDRHDLTVTRTQGALGPVVTVVGPVDIVTVEEVRQAMRTAGRSGLLPLTVDLSEVTMLASAGVHALHEQCEEALASGERLRVIAPPRSTSRDVLAFSGLADLVEVLDG
jgi:anti-anti-sigma factor